MIVDAYRVWEALVKLRESEVALSTKRPLIVLDGVAVRVSSRVSMNAELNIDFSAVFEEQPKYRVSLYEIECSYLDGRREKYEAEELTQSIRPSGRWVFEFTNCRRVAG